ncbi:divalent-cation tolerance protein CutA [bacterium]|nr:divalent-cation tolerance protein CutA [bacterium]
MKIILTTCKTKDSHEIALKLLKEGLAACVSSISGMRSRYVWKGEIQVEEEKQLLIKTSDKMLEKTLKRLAEIHPYEIPEIVVITPEYISENYLNWINQTLDK